MLTAYHKKAQAMNPKRGGDNVLRGWHTPSTAYAEECDHELSRHAVGGGFFGVRVGQINMMGKD